MNESVKTKKALRGSLFALFLCIVLLIGTTFAWFTDSVSTGVNKIQAGKLKVGLEYKNAENKTFTSVTEETKVFNDGALWEPGHVEYAVLKVKNEGNLALKYKLGVNIASEKGSTNVNGDAFKLSDYINFAVVDGDQSNLDRAALVAAAGEGQLINKGYSKESHLDTTGADETVTLVVWMPETVGNEANHATNAAAPEINLGVNVAATQKDYESDSFDNTYDKNATYPVGNASSLADAVADLGVAGSNNITVSIAKDLAKTSGIKVADGNKFTLDMNGKTVGVNYGEGSKNTTTNGMQLLKGSTVTLKNGTYAAEHGNDSVHNIAILIQNYSDLTIENCNLDMSNANDTAGNSKKTSYVISSNYGDVIIKGNSNITARKGEYALDVMHWENDSYKDKGTHVVFDESMTGTVDGKIDVYCYRGGRVIKPVEDGGATLVIKGGTFKNSGLSLEQFKKFVPSGYKVTTNSDRSFTVSK